MANNIQRKDLFQGLGNIKKVEQWLKAGDKLGLRVCGGSKHPSTIRNPNMPDDEGSASLIATIPNNLHRHMNQVIFKEFLKFGVQEESLWKALGILK
ncbi:MAG: hypothetical protein EXS51_02415 [Candidatus Taylorbacteria bacterium]|nr:hypothetical protein [Candidatus Taylorbacteria bacterium]